MRTSTKPQTFRSWLRQQHPWVVWVGAAWLVVLGIWMPVLATMHNHHASTSSLVATGLPLGAIAVTTTLVFGGGLGYLKQWKAAGIATLVGAGVLLFWLSWITISAPDPNNQNDHSAGIATVILAVPTVVLVGMILAMGAGIGRVTRALFSST